VTCWELFSDPIILLGRAIASSDDPSGHWFLRSSGAHEARCRQPERTPESPPSGECSPIHDNQELHKSTPIKSVSGLSLLLITPAHRLQHTDTLTPPPNQLPHYPSSRLHHRLYLPRNGAFFGHQCRCRLETRCRLAGAASASKPTSTADIFPSAVAVRAEFDDADFAIDSTKIKGNPNAAGNVRVGNVAGFPVLGLYDIDSSFALMSLAADAHNLPHTHPRASETLYLLKGKLDVSIVEENSAPPVLVIDNTLQPGGIAIFPTGLIHGQRCVAKDGCKFLAVLGSADPEAVTVAARLCDGPVEAVAASFRVLERLAERMCVKLPENPAPSQPSGDRHQ